MLVAHSNAGLLVPDVVQASRLPVMGCLFVDASLPSRTGPTPAASPERLAYLRTITTEGRLPQWTTWWDEDDVALLFPDQQTRSAVSAEQPRLPLSYYEQQIPAPAGWDHRPCGYLLFGPPYDRMAQESQERGWDVDQVPGGHLHQLVDPDAVTARILAMTARWGSQPAEPTRLICRATATNSQAVQPFDVVDGACMSPLSATRAVVLSRLRSIASVDHQVARPWAMYFGPAAPPESLVTTASAASAITSSRRPWPSAWAPWRT